MTLLYQVNINFIFFNQGIYFQSDEEHALKLQTSSGVPLTFRCCSNLCFEICQCLIRKESHDLKVLSKVVNSEERCAFNCNGDKEQLGI